MCTVYSIYSIYYIQYILYTEFLWLNGAQLYSLAHDKIDFLLVYCAFLCIPFSLAPSHHKMIVIGWLSLSINGKLERMYCMWLAGLSSTCSLSLNFLY